MQLLLWPMTSLLLLPTGPKKCEAGVKIPLGRNYGREKICHMDNRSGQWAGGELSIMEEIPAPSFSFLTHFWSRFPRGKEKHAHTHLTYSWQCKIAFHAQLTLHPFGIHFGYPDFSQGNCTWQYAKLHSECNWLESHYYRGEGEGKNVLAILFLCLSGSCYSDGNKQTNKLLSGVSLRIHNWKQM